MGSRWTAIAISLLTALLGLSPAAEPAAGKSALPEMRTFALGQRDANAPAAVVAADGSCTVAASGAQASNGRDEATFAGFETEAPAFTFVARVARATGATAASKYGLAIRDSAWGPAKAVYFGYAARQDQRGLCWFMRHTSRPRDDEGGLRCFVDGLAKATDRTDGCWLRLVRRYPYVELAFSDDGKTWQAVGHRLVLLAPKVLVGLQATAGAGAAGPVTILYDHLAFTADGPAGAEGPAAFQEFAPDSSPGRLYLAQVKGDKAPFSAYLLMARDLDPKRIRAVLLTPGNKEILRAGNKPLEFESSGTLRKPKQMRSFEGTCDIEDLRPFYQGMAQHGIVRIGGVFPAADYRKAVERLATVSGIAHLPNVPVLAMSGSAALGPERCVAALGQPSSDLQTPHLSVFNTHDGGGLSAMVKTLPGLRGKHALWACAPMWTVGHKPSQGEALAFPFFVEALRLRIPADADFTKGPVSLRPVREADGWLGLTDTWTTNFPQVMPYKDSESTGQRVWLLGADVAHTWQAAVANFPRTVIHFPTFEGNSSFDMALPAYWHNSILAANTAIEVVASGPAGTAVTVDFYEGARKLKVLKTHGHPYRVTLEGLEAGLHAIHAVSVVDGVREVSHPVLLTVLPGKGDAGIPDNRHATP